MADNLDSAGLVLSTLPEIIENLEAGFRTIYGDDINLDPDTPDGQLINLLAQTCIDLREVLANIYASFDPDQAQGRVLDQRVAINGLERNGGTFTVVPVSITADRNVTLLGMDSESESLNIPAGVFTIKDTAGTQFVLLDSITIAAGVHSLLFRAAQIGAVMVDTGTITTAVTAMAGITAINNTSGVLTQGVDEESDAALKIRRRRSVAGPSTSYLDSMESAVLALSGVTACIIEENNTGVIDANGTDPHTVWAIVEGGDDEEIAQALYRKKSAGAGWRGAETVTVTRPNGRTIEVSFDRPGEEDLYIRFNIVVIGGGVIDTANLKSMIVENVTFQIGEDASTDKIVSYLKGINQNYRITGAQVSTDDASWFEVVTLSEISNKFILDVARIDIT